MFTNLMFISKKSAKVIMFLLNVYYKLVDNCIGAKAFSDLTEEDVDDPSLGFSFGGKKLLKKILARIKVWRVIVQSSSKCFDNYL